MLLAVLAPLAFVGPKVPVRRELNLSVALRHVIEVDLFIVDRLVGIFSVDGLDDELALITTSFVASGAGDWMEGSFERSTRNCDSRIGTYGTNFYFSEISFITPRSFHIMF